MRFLCLQVRCDAHDHDSNFWQYFEPIRQAMPANCSADVQAVIGHFDKVFSGKNTSAINDLKASFGMGEITHLDDVVSARKCLLLVHVY